MNGVRLTPQHIEQLKAATDKTGCGAAMFLRWADNVPKGLNSMTINHWLAERVAEANSEHLAFVLEHWPQMPRRIAVTDELIETLKAEEERTGLSPKRLIGTMRTVPDGLTPAKITLWKTMRADKAREDHVRAVLDAYAAIPSTKT